MDDVSGMFEPFIFRIDAFSGNNHIPISIGEIGVIFTALNRSINQMVGLAGNIDERNEKFSKADSNYEPNLVQVLPIEASVGSFEVRVVFDWIHSVGLNHPFARDILVGLAANAIWDTKRSRILLRNLRKAIVRVSKYTTDKTFQITISIGIANRRYQIHVHEGVLVEVGEIQDEDGDNYNINA